MKQVYFSAANKRSKSGIFIAILITLGIIFSAFFAGAIIGIDPAIAVRLIVVLAMPLVLAVVWSAPKSAEDPGPRLNSMIAALLLAAVFWPSYIIFSVRSLPSIEPKRLILLVILAYWLYKMFTAPQLAQRFFSRWKVAGWSIFFFVSFLVWRVLSALVSDAPVYSVIQFGWNLINYYLIFFVALSSLRDTSDIVKLLKIMMWSAVVVALVGFIERVVGHNLFANIVSVTTASLQTALEEKIRDGTNRVQATFEHPMILAEYLVFSIPLLMFVVIKSKRGFSRFFAASGLVITFGGIFLSGTRSAILAGAGAFGVTLILYFLDNMRSRRLSMKTFISTLGLVSVVASVFVAVPIMAELIQGRSAIERNSSGARVLQYKLGIPKILKEPVFGYGVAIGNQTLGFKASQGRFSVDSYYLTLMLDSGIPGALFFIFTAISFGFLGIRISLSKSTEDVRLLGRVLALSLFGLIITQAVLSAEQNLVFLSLVCAMLIVLKQQAFVSKTAYK